MTFAVFARRSKLLQASPTSPDMPPTIHAATCKAETATRNINHNVFMWIMIVAAASKEVHPFPHLIQMQLTFRTESFSIAVTGPARGATSPGTILGLAPLLWFSRETKRTTTILELPQQHPNWMQHSSFGASNPSVLNVSLRPLEPILEPAFLALGLVEILSGSALHLSESGDANSQGPG